MKVLWLCNSVPEQIRKLLGYNFNTTESWLEELSKKMAEAKNIEFGLVSPMFKDGYTKTQFGDESKFWGYPLSIDNESSGEELISFFKEICADFKPDVIHIFGTEYFHSYAMVNAVDDTSRIVIHLQGIISEYAGHYLDFVPERLHKKQSLKDMLRHDSMLKRSQFFAKNGNREILAVKAVSYVMGRTAWDRGWSERVNAKIRYHKVNEAIRDAFFQHTWSFDACKKHSIFLSQMSYPIKGGHVFLQALKKVVEEYPDTIVYVAGKNLYSKSSLRSILSKDYYQQYITRFINNNGLKKYVKFTGGLDANGMVEHFLGSNVFVLPSTIENSPNSILEAKAMGVPIIASNVGGVSSLVTDSEEALLFQSGNVDELAEDICKVFRMQDEVSKMSYSGMERIAKENNVDAVFEGLIGVYKEMMY